ncbi:hypothetical protein E8E12_009742 [Didymella heteroderae]|uniref:Uncharacterized protein n=1 Tax=Didymella heteroderae TaxID=1769908 RepID=A0A9P4WW68_9PLEO|nr:hypothetical protein E8E12_009742 [Didymella heteroderae]
MSEAQLADITGHLNASSQLNPNNRTSKALPLTYASKLAHRVHDYFRFNLELPEVKKEHKNEPEVRKPLELEAVRKVKSFLKITYERQRPWKSELDGSMHFL